MSNKKDFGILLIGLPILVVIGIKLHKKRKFEVWAADCIATEKKINQELENLWFHPSIKEEEFKEALEFNKAFISIISNNPPV